MKNILTILLGLILLKSYGQNMEKLTIDGIEVEIHRNFYESGELNQEWLQTIYELHGYHKTFYKSGRLKEHLEYRKNEWAGVDNRYFEDGTKEQKVSKINDTLFLNEAWYKNGNKKHRFNQNIKKQRVGDEIIWFENGNIQLQILYNDSLNKNGSYKAFYENGELQLSAKYEDGKYLVIDFFTGERKQTLKNGAGFIETFQNGNLLYLDNYVNGLRNGVCKIFFKNGNLRNEGNFIDGKSEGKSIWYKLNGDIEEIINMENDVMTHREKK
jgi:uncharacterized protein